MKSLIIVLIVGIIILFVGFMLPLGKGLGVTAWYVTGLGLVMVVGAIIAAVMRLWGRMLSD